MTRAERKRDIEAVSPHMETLRNIRPISGMPCSYWALMTVTLVIAVLVYVAEVYLSR